MGEIDDELIELLNLEGLQVKDGVVIGWDEYLRSRGFGGR